MKKVNIYTAILTAVMLTVGTACEDFLEQQSFGTLTSESLYNTESDAVAGITGAYEKSNSAIGRRLMILVDLPGDELNYRNTGTGSRGVFDNYTWTATHSYIRDTYDNHYEAIKMANSVVDNMDKVEDISDEMRNHIRGEARFLRSLWYFNLVRLFHDVPLITSSNIDLNNAEAPQSTATEIYDFIIEDLKLAEQELLEQPQAVGRVGRGAAQGVLAKVLLHRAKTGFSTTEQQDYVDAATLTGKVISAGVHDLHPQIDQLFGVYTAQDLEGDNEFMFSVQNLSSVPGGQHHSEILYYGGLGDFGHRGWSAFGGDVTHYNRYDNNDLRKSTFYLTSYDDDGSMKYFDIDDMGGDDFSKQDGPFPTKHFDVFNKTPISVGRDMSVLRYADILLLHAEAILARDGAPNTEAYDAINQVIRRAHGEDPSTAGAYDLAGMTSAQFREAVFTERKKELMFEGHGWFDGLRFWDLFVRDTEAASRAVHLSITPMTKDQGNSNTQITVDDKFKVFPLPQDALDKNPLLKQNPIWSTGS
ncbi:MAG: RagB/SusD family nutrient uptake outer membrane protein [Reichenbachiella sp.]|uniref:RagB/SusD family nutrient uptake outer membrane protein n=1 Tax=Reichenbachiella sp. TaxID=2184521 RepID=UPI00329A2F95